MPNSSSCLSLSELVSFSLLVNGTAWIAKIRFSCRQGRILNLTVFRWFNGLRNLLERRVDPSLSQAPVIEIEYSCKSPDESAVSVLKFRAVLFDLDGTLLDTLEDLADSMNASLKRFSFSPLPVEMYRYLVGEGLVNLVLRALPEGHRDEETLNMVIAAQLEEYGCHWANKTRMYDGVPDLLDGLTERQLPICILSNKPDDLTNAVVAKFLSGWSFAVVRGQRERIPMKPDPAGANQIAFKLGVPAGEFLYVGDSKTDMQTANAAGMFSLGALWGYRTRNELITAGAKALAERPLDVLHLVMKQRTQKKREN